MTQRLADPLAIATEILTSAAAGDKIPPELNPPHPPLAEEEGHLEDEPERPLDLYDFDVASTPDIENAAAVGAAMRQALTAPEREPPLELAGERPRLLVIKRLEEGVSFATETFSLRLPLRGQDDAIAINDRLRAFCHPGFGDPVAGHC